MIADDSSRSSQGRISDLVIFSSTRLVALTSEHHRCFAGILLHDMRLTVEKRGIALKLQEIDDPRFALTGQAYNVVSGGAVVRSG